MSSRIGQLIGAVIFVLTTAFSYAEQDPIGTWRAYMPYGSSTGIADAGEVVYCASAYGVFSYEKSTGAIRTYDKSSGLNDVGVKVINYDLSSKTLVIAYNNNNLDLIVNGTDIYNIPDIMKKSATGAIIIYDISFHNGRAYLCTSLGISVIDLAKKEIGDTYIIGKTGTPIAVYGAANGADTIYAATDEGIKYAATSSNLLDYNSWTGVAAGQGLPAQKAGFVNIYNDKVYAVIGKSGTDTLYEYDGTGWKQKYYHENFTFQSLEVAGSNLYFTVWDANGPGQLGKITATSAEPSLLPTSKARPVNWFEEDNITWFGDGYNGFFKLRDGTYESIIPDGPFSTNVFRMDVRDGVLNVAPGGVDESWFFTYNRDGFFIYRDNKWVYRNQYTDNALADLSDILSVASIPALGKTYFGSYYAGLIEYDNNTKKLKIYDKNNSILEGQQGDDSRTKLPAMKADRYNNLWIGNSGATRPLKLLKSDGTWKDFRIPVSFALMKNMIIDQYDQIWAPVRGGANNGSLIVWTYNQTLDDSTDDQVKMLATGAGAGGLPEPNVYCVAEDRDGNIWVGTGQGIGIYYCAGSIFTEQTCDADQIKVVADDGFVGYLFGTESVRAIAVDAANRKWIGTTNGLWLISADGQKQLLNFNSTNSPMPSSQVTDIVIDDASGEVFIGTTSGLVSYQGDAVSECTDCPDGALVYPNPIKPGYEGPIAIKGLALDAYVKITDITGTLVYQGRANGSQMVWDGKNYNGVRVKSGVYLVASSTDLGKEKHVGKFVVMN